MSAATRACWRCRRCHRRCTSSPASSRGKACRLPSASPSCASRVRCGADPQPDAPPQTVRQWLNAHRQSARLCTDVLGAARACRLESDRRGRRRRDVSCRAAADVRSRPGSGQPAAPRGAARRSLCSSRRPITCGRPAREVATNAFCHVHSRRRPGDRRAGSRPSRAGGHGHRGGAVVCVCRTSSCRRRRRCDVADRERRRAWPARRSSPSTCGSAGRAARDAVVGLPGRHVPVGVRPPVRLPVRRSRRSRSCRAAPRRFARCRTRR